jgi:heat shock protein HslJ
MGDPARRWLTVLATAGLAVSLASCGPEKASHKADPHASRTGLEDRAWVLDPVASDVALNEGAAVSVLFDGETFGGVILCNSYGGDYSVDGITISVSEVISTLAGCGDGQLSEDVGALFNGTMRFEVSEDRLTLEGEAGELTLTFREIPPDDEVDQAAVEGSWTVHPIGGGPAAATTLTIAADGSYDASVGCAQYGGRWDVDRGRIAAPERFGALDDSCSSEGEPYVPSSDEPLVAAAIGGAHLRSVGGGLEVLDHSGAPVAILRPAAES